ncbi:CHAT domain-containing protein [Sphaerisporangium sp. NPDC051011]|uniref:CHAT domain-containing protein n=1 Tax=Sphaerisporangium sp. NPDC051011 TaxID=3155792 RepID=UPI0033FAF3D1
MSGPDRVLRGQTPEVEQAEPRTRPDGTLDGWHLAPPRPRDAFVARAFTDDTLSLSPDGSFAARLGSATLRGNWWTAGGSLEFAAESPPGEGRPASVDGYLTLDAGGAWTLDALYLGPGRFGSVIAHVRQRLVPLHEQEAGPVVRRIGDVPVPTSYAVTLRGTHNGIRLPEQPAMLYLEKPPPGSPLAVNVTLATDTVTVPGDMMMIAAEPDSSRVTASGGIVEVVIDPGPSDPVGAFWAYREPRLPIAGLVQARRGGARIDVAGDQVTGRLWLGGVGADGVAGRYEATFSGRRVEADWVPGEGGGPPGPGPYPDPTPPSPAPGGAVERLRAKLADASLRGRWRAALGPGGRLTVSTRTETAATGEGPGYAAGAAVAGQSSGYARGVAIAGESSGDVGESSGYAEVPIAGEGSERAGGVAGEDFWSVPYGPVNRVARPGPGDALGRRGFLRLAPGPDVAAGLVPEGGDLCLAVLVRDDPDEEASDAFTAEDRAALRHLGIDLQTSGRYGQADRVLERAARLYADPPATGDMGKDVLDRLGLVEARIRCAFARSDHARMEDLLAVLADLRRTSVTTLSPWRSVVRSTRASVADLADRLRYFRQAAADARERLLGGPDLVTATEVHAAASDAVAALAPLEEVVGRLRPAPENPATLTLAASELDRALAAVERQRAAVFEPDRAPADGKPASDELPGVDGLRAAVFEPDRAPADGKPASDELPGADGLRAAVSEPDRAPAAVDGLRAAVAELDGALAAAADGLRAAVPAPWASSDHTGRVYTEVLGEDEVPAPRELFAILARDGAGELDLLRDRLARSDAAGGAARLRDGTQEGVRLASRYVEMARALLDDDWDRIQSTRRAMPFYERIVTLLLDLDAPEDALVASEMSRARAFADLLEARSDRPAPPGLEAAGVVDRTRLAEILAAHDATVVEYFLAGDLLVIWVVPPGGPMRVIRRPLDRRRLAEAVGTFRRLAELGRLTDPLRRDMADALRLLHAELWQVIPADLLPADPDTPVTVVPHAELFQVPFCALLDAEGTHLVHWHAIRVLPALAILPDLAARRARTAGAPPSLVALIDPAPLTDGSEPLEVLERRFGDIAGYYAEGRRRVHRGPDAGFVTLREAGAEGTVLFFGTHAKVVENDPMMSYVALAGSDADDGLLRARDIPALDLAADLVILAACETGAGDVTPDGVIGLSRAFLAAGPSGLLMTLYRVGEVTTLDVMAEFHGCWLEDGLRPVSALRRAQAEAAAELSTSREPHVWAACTYYGL